MHNICCFTNRGVDCEMGGRIDIQMFTRNRHHDAISKDMGRRLRGAASHIRRKGLLDFYEDSETG